jgi:hypothetical protein
MEKTQDHRVSKEWSSRPDDQRFLSLEELRTSVANRMDSSQVAVTETVALKAYGTEEGELIVDTEIGAKLFTNWSFGQFSQVAGAPAAYLKKLSAPLAAENLNYGLARSERLKSMLLVGGDDRMRAITSEQYGRIWDREVVDAVIKVTDGGTWQIPASSYATTNPKRATTLYASDRDVFIFLVDPEHPIMLPGETEPLFRGFYSWNSEVGAQTFGLAAFLYQRICDNRIIWGQSHKSELRIKHSSGAPTRFLKEGKEALIEYANESTQPIVERITRAKNISLGKNIDEVKAFLKAKGLTLSTVDTTMNILKQEGKDPTNAWSVTEGMTMAARAINHTDTRIELERTAGKILSQVTA